MNNMENIPNNSLHEAVRNGNIEIVRSLLEPGFNVNRKENKYPGNTPLHLAAQNDSENENFIDILKLLLNFGANVNERNYLDQTPLQHALSQVYQSELIRNYRSELIRVLIDSGADVNSKNTFGQSASYFAAQWNDVKMMEYLISKGANINVRDNQSYTPLHIATLMNEDESHFEIVEILLKNKIYVDAQTNHGSTALHYSVVRRNVKTVELLLNYKADVTVKEVTGKTALFIAVGNNSIEIVKLLIDHFSGVEIEPTEKSRLLHEAAQQNGVNSHFEVAEILLKNGFSVNARDPDKRTPLHYLVRQGSVEIVRLFLNYKADVNVMDNAGETPLFEAVLNTRNVDVVRLLIDQGLDVNVANLVNRNTPLHKVFERATQEIYDPFGSNLYFENNMDMIKCLFESGANISALDSEGRTPLSNLVNSSYFTFHDEYSVKLLKFLLKYVDTNVLVENNIFRNMTNFGYWKVISQHVAKLKVLNIPVQQNVLDRVLNRNEINDHFHNQDDIDNYFQKCLNELSVAKTCKLPGSWITFFNLLVDNKRKLKNYAGNEDLMKGLKSTDCLKKFPVYGEEMQKILEKAILRRKVFDKSLILLSNFLPIFNPNHLIIRGILDCMYSQDLEKFST